MNKISIFLIILIMSSVPFAFAHPYTNTAVIMGDEGEILVKLIGVGYQKDDKKELEFLSTAWFWKNFILLLGSSIIVTMTYTVVSVYREKITS